MTLKVEVVNSTQKVEAVDLAKQRTVRGSIPGGGGFFLARVLPL